MKTDKVVVNVGVGGWYPKGSRRLQTTLGEQSELASQLIYIDTLPAGSPSHTQMQYVFKAYALEQAANLGYRYILWCDSSLYATGKLTAIWDKIARDGYYMINNGYNCANTCTDRLLESFGISRDIAETIPEITTCCFGFDVKSEKGEAFLKMFVHTAKAGLFSGGREWRAEDSTDRRFMFARHDQSAASIIADLLGWKPNAEYGMDVQYLNGPDGKPGEVNNSVCLVNWGQS